MDFAEIAGLASEILQRNVTRIVVSEEEYRKVQLAHGYPERMVDLLASLFAATRALEFDEVDPTLERILGRKPVAMRETLRDFLLNAEAMHAS